MSVAWSDYGKYATDIFTDEAVETINNHGNANTTQPLFLYLAHLAVHSANTVKSQILFINSQPKSYDKEGLFGIGMAKYFLYQISSPQQESEALKWQKKVFKEFDSIFYVFLIRGLQKYQRN